MRFVHQRIALVLTAGLFVACGESNFSSTPQTAAGEEKTQDQEPNLTPYAQDEVIDKEKGSTDIIDNGDPSVDKGKSVITTDIEPSAEESPEPALPLPPEGDPLEGVSGGSVVFQPPQAADLKAIAGCQAALGLPSESFSNVRKITASISILGGGSTLVDRRVTEKPELTLVVAAINVLSAAKWELMNPNGFYCIVANANILTSLNITIDKNARLADSAVGINILSQGNANPAAATVNVLSNVKVTKK